MKVGLHRLSFVTGSVVAKILFGVVLYVVVLTKVNHDVASDAFQALLLQSAIITITCGSAYPRAVAAKGNLQVAAGLTVAFLVITLALAAFTLSTAAILSPSGAIPRFARVDVLALLLIGGFATGLHTLFQGLFLEKQGGARTFLPITISQIIAAVAVLLVHVESMPGLAAIVAAAQVLPLVLYAAWNHRAIVTIDYRHAATNTQAVRGYLSETLSFGVTSTIYLLVFLAIREVWRGHVDASTAAFVFFAMRISDVYTQVAYYMFASSSFFEVTDDGLKIGKRRFSRPGAILIFTGLLAVSLAGIALAFRVLPHAGLAFTVLAAQVLVDATRLPASMFSIAMLKASRPTAYAAVLLPSLVVMAFTTYAFSRIHGGAALYVAQTLLGFTIVASWAVVARINGGQRPTPGQ